MRAQQGIGSILLLIAIIVVAVIVAVLFIQTAQELKNTASTVTKQQQQTLLDRLTVREVTGVSGNCGGEKCVTGLIIRVTLATGSNPIDLRKTVLIFSSRDAEAVAKYVPPEELYELNGTTDLNTLANHVNGYSGEPACAVELMEVMNLWGTSSMVDVYDRLEDALDESRYTALWLVCDEKGDTRSLLTEQEILVFYKLPSPLFAGDDFKLKFLVPQGTSYTGMFYVPRGFEGKTVDIYGV